MKETIRYIRNRKLQKVSEQIFEGIANGRKRALENWFSDCWRSMEVIKNLVVSGSFDEIQDRLNIQVEKSNVFLELFVTKEDGDIVASTYPAHIGKSIAGFPSLEKAKQGEAYMYGPYIDPMTLDIDIIDRTFYDEVTLLFSIPVNLEEKRLVLCARVLNDDMSNVIQEEDTHIYKDSGDNYLFMIKNYRGIPQGMAISRSRFEDSTFTLGDNLMQGVRTKKWGIVQVKKHTELEIIFNDPATGKLHQGVQNTINHGENLDCWPGYPDYRHIMVGGKGTTIQPPHSDEIWGMMCEGDIADIYHLTSISSKTACYTGILTLLGLIAKYMVIHKCGMNEIVAESLFLAYLVLITYVMSRRIVIWPLHQVTDILQTIAEGEGDLSRRVDIKSNNEIGQLIRWFNKFVSNQMFMIKRVAGSLKTSKQAVKTVTVTNENIQTSMKVIRQTIDVLSQNAIEQKELYEKTNNEVRKISDSFEQNKELEELVVKIREKTKETEVLASGSEKAKQETNDVNGELRSSMDIAVDSMASLEEKSVEITNIISTIQGISKKTGLLSLNASIEAARAGEVGRGFQVVAEEIKSLSEGTNQATTTIKALIESIQSEIDRTKDSILGIEGNVERSIQFSKQSVQAVVLVADISKIISYILTMIEDQSNTIKEAKENIKSMEKSNVLTVQVGETKVQEAITLMEAINKQSAQLSKVIESLTYSTNDLSDIVASFTVK